ncbi:glycogen debranching protein GlgX [Marinihelvus fidelis]|uniref:Glycogen debranching protein GlgX n=1 Tax=Marinihelvus fidelis TaxID=2613842 RepID=A0A5N0T9I5_9GAMM|nr:glycogen debranching protein GlgX [Marinihelvus fidelis]KAA9130466.1 glycogen debranching protein GlgX [Marinihelvus fidelis]
MLERGDPGCLGGRALEGGANFAVYASRAERVELCLFDAHGNATGSFDLPGHDDGVWHGFFPGLSAGQAYGYRVHGPHDPKAGLRHHPGKLLIDPWARRLSGEVRWDPSLFDTDPSDSAGAMPRSLVTAPGEGAGPVIRRDDSGRIPWSEAVVYETHVRGYTMRHPGLTEAERGRFKGMANHQVLDYIRALGVTHVELMPVHSMVDEAFLSARGLRNYWGYNSIQFFTPAARYGGEDPVVEFRDMVNAIHDAGLEVILDVVYNHTGEGGEDGPTLGFRGLDNLAYYRTLPGDPSTYINDTGCGNTINADHPRVQELVTASLEYWHRDMGVDGFRFDLAPILGQTATGFRTDHPLLRAITTTPGLRNARLVAEPWGPGPGGYRLGEFPPGWSEWNDRYRDTARRFWRGDAQQLAPLASRIHGSSDLFDRPGRGPLASVNFITSHDGFTLSDLVSYKRRHNHANGEDNRDGHSHNYSCNHGVEGPTDRGATLALRRRHRLNLLTTLLLSQGVPMLLAGDEFGNSQGGNNNAYAQDNETGWLDWSGLDHDPEFVQLVRALIRIRRRQPLLRQPEYVHGQVDEAAAGKARYIDWFNVDGEPMAAGDWAHSRAVMKLLSGQGNELALLVNGHDFEARFVLPGGGWVCEFCSDARQYPGQNDRFDAPAWSMTCLVRG